MGGQIAFATTQFTVIPYALFVGDRRIGQNCMIGPDVRIGDGCKIQNNVSMYAGVELADDPPPPPGISKTGLSLFLAWELTLVVPKSRPERYCRTLDAAVARSECSLQL
jgi:carbonic anhydrase/acetyltransferase-like protein (isoleucine patch superfamily)